MSVDFKITEGAQAVAGPASGTIAMIGCCVGGTAAAKDVGTWDPGSDAQVPAVLGYGRLCEALERKIRIAGVRTLSVKAANSVIGTVSAVVHHNSIGTDSPAATGPTVTAAAVAAGAYDKFAIVAKITKAGTNGVAQMQVALDGSTYGGTIDIPALLPATLVGTADLSIITASSLDTNVLNAVVDAHLTDERPEGSLLGIRF